MQSGSDQKRNWLRVDIIAPGLITLVCLTLAAVHAIKPELLTLDKVTLGLLAVGALAWFIPALESLKWGDVEVKFLKERVVAQQEVINALVLASMSADIFDTLELPVLVPAHKLLTSYGRMGRRHLEFDAATPSLLYDHPVPAATPMREASGLGRTVEHVSPSSAARDHPLGRRGPRA